MEQLIVFCHCVLVSKPASPKTKYPNVMTWEWDSAIKYISTRIALKVLKYSFNNVNTAVKLFSFLFHLGTLTGSNTTDETTV